MSSLPSSNWLALQKTLNKSHFNPSKRRKLSHAAASPLSPVPSTSTTKAPQNDSSQTHETGDDGTNSSKTSLRNMVTGKLNYTPSQRLPGRYLALDCEMVGVGVNGSESSLARVSLVNWYGAVQLDAFVRQRERVVDYRTRWSGIRERDMLKAKPFAEVQKEVADMLKEKILVGHAVHNDLKALLLSHPRPSTRDTQIYAHKFHLTKSNRIALRNLVKEQLELTIQEGEHSSVTDARAAMAVYRLHKKKWEGGINDAPNSKKRKRGSLKGKDKFEEPNNDHAQSDPEDQSSVEAELMPSQKSNGTGKAMPDKKGISSGLSVVIKQRGVSGKKTIGKAKGKGNTDSEEKKAWWTELPSGGGFGGSKRRVRLKSTSS